jgi:two-component system sensor histidine kinase PilS (NtrC family)
MSPAIGTRLGLQERMRSAARMPMIGVDDETAWRALVVFCGYRVVMALVLAGAYAFLNAIFLLGTQQPGLAVAILAGYLVVAIALAVPALLREPSLMVQVTTGVLVDVAAIVALMHTSGGIRSGLGAILLISLASAGLITRGRLAFFHAAVAALAVLVEQVFQVWRFDAPANDFFQSGLTSMALFATAGLGYTLANYARTSEKLAEQRTIDLANLSQINELVIRDMQDGILVVDPEGTIRQHNPRVAQLLGPLPPGRRPPLAEYAPEVAERMAAWRRGPETTFLQFQSPRSGTELALHFVAIGTGDPPPTVIFVEDVGRMRAQARQMKLIALGRLTASIAHEIRNPLSSIGHAAQLLGEDLKAAQGGERLIAIIRDNVRRLDRIVEEVLYLNRRDRAQPEAIEARTYLANFVADFCASEKVPHEGVDLEVRTSQRVVFDRQHLDQVLWNLARNAWRHGRKRTGSLRIVLAPGDIRATLLLDVRDDGPGISAQDQAHLFEPFFTTDAQGTGLGLYIARELCEGNGARIEYIQNPAGAQFRVTMKGV